MYIINSGEISHEPVVGRCSMIQIHGDKENNAVSETNSYVNDVSEKERVKCETRGCGCDSDNEFCQDIQGKMALPYKAVWTLIIDKICGPSTCISLFWSFLLSLKWVIGTTLS